LDIFVGIEMTGQNVAFEQKFNYRRPMYIVMDYLWQIEEQKNVFSKYIAPLFLFERTGSCRLSYVILFLKMRARVKMYEICAIDPHITRGLHCHCLRVHENSYLWAVNKTVVPTVTVHSCMISIKGNC